MNRITTALLAALEAVVAVGIGLGVAVIPLTVLWAAHYHLAEDWSLFWKAAADFWLTGNGVNLTVTLPATTATILGLPDASVPFQVTIAVLGFALLAVILGARTGIKAATGPYGPAAVVSAIVAYGVLAAVVTLSASSSVVAPSVWQGVSFPVLIYAAGIALGIGLAQTRDGADPQTAAGHAIRARIERLGPALRSGIGWSLRSGTVAAGVVLAASALATAVMILVHYADVVALYEGLHAGALGGAMLTLAQLAFLPNLVIWTASWFVGPGFAIGTGSSVSPVGTQLGPIPSLPVFGALPQGDLVFGFLGLAVPVLAGFGVAMATRRVLDREGIPPRAGWCALVALGTGAVAGAELGLLAWWSSGALGPGRLHDTGPNPWLVAGIAAIEIAICALVGIFAGDRRSRT